MLANARNESRTVSSTPHRLTESRPLASERAEAILRRENITEQDQRTCSRYCARCPMTSRQSQRRRQGNGNRAVWRSTVDRRPPTPTGNEVAR